MERLTSGLTCTADMSEAIARLKKYEDLHEELEKEQDRLSEQMAKLREEGKEKTVKYRELFTRKLQNVYVLSLFKSRGL